MVFFKDSMRRTSIIVITIAIYWVEKPNRALKALYSFKGSSVSKTSKQTETNKRNTSIKMQNSTREVEVNEQTNAQDERTYREFKAYYTLLGQSAAPYIDSFFSSLFCFFSYLYIGKSARHILLYIYIYIGLYVY